MVGWHGEEWLCHPGLWKKGRKIGQRASKSPHQEENENDIDHALKGGEAD